ncbi:hypothetical protein EDD36DRAFT_19690 [Exophiala viscosa]|uniref:Uncharacterized protein n=1 Tax=Exophiala viscosa TaxID=2486360 RepID=A0AAN6IHV2_9EURO|nr:hypothetical protein EDD36DRAFT_19690 [Exophiala viscosa]
MNKRTSWPLSLVSIRFCVIIRRIHGYRDVNVRLESRVLMRQAHRSHFVAFMNHTALHLFLCRGSIVKHGRRREADKVWPVLWNRHVCTDWHTGRCSSGVEKRQA